MANLSVLIVQFFLKKWSVQFDILRMNYDAANLFCINHSFAK